MKRLNWIAAVLVFLGLMPVSACSGPPVATNMPGEDRRAFTVDPRQTAINGITLLMTERDIVQLLGEPDAVEEGYSEPLDTPWKDLFYAGLKISFLKQDDIVRLVCTGHQCRTERGVKIGDSRFRVIATYGAGYPHHRTDTCDTLHYPLMGSDSYLVFVFENDVVTGIEFWVDFM